MITGGTSMFVEVELMDVVENPLGSAPIVVLKEKEGERVCCIQICIMEAGTIADELDGIMTPRPMPHDLLLDVLDQFGAELDGVYIEREMASTYYASMRLHNGTGKSIVLDARPSDAITIALKNSRPIFMKEKLFHTGKPDRQYGSGHSLLSIRSGWLDSSDLP